MGHGPCGCPIADESEEEDDNPDDLVLAQFEKVSRAKNKWKCNLKDGIIRVNDRDYVFHKGTPRTPASRLFDWVGLSGCVFCVMEVCGGWCAAC